MWPSHLILMFADIAIIDLSLFSGVEYTKHGKRPRQACVTAAFTEHFLSSLSVSQSGCAQMRGPDATLHLMLQLSYMLILISPTRFYPMDPLAGASLVTHIMWTRGAQTFRTISHSSRDPSFSKDLNVLG